MSDQNLTGLSDDYYDYGPHSGFDETLTPKQQRDIDAIRRAEDAVRQARENFADDADGL